MDLLLRHPTLTLLLTVHFLYFITLSSMLILPKWFVELGYSEGEIGVFMGVAGITALVVTFLVGQVLDRIRRIRFIKAGIIGIILTTISLPLVVHSSTLLILLRLLNGIMFSLAFPAVAALVTDVAPENRRVQALGLFGVATLSTQALSPMLGEWLAGLYGFQNFFFIISATSGVALLLSVPLGRRLEAEGIGMPADPDESMPGTVYRPKDRLYWPLILFVASVGAIFGGMLTFVPVMLVTAGIDRVGTFFVVSSAASVAVRLFFGGLGDRLDRDRLMFVSATGIAVSALGTAAVFAVGIDPESGDLIQVVVGAFFGFWVGFFYPVANVRFIELGPDAMRGRYMAYYSTVYSSGITGATLLFGYVVEWFDYGVMFAVAAVLALVAMAGYWVALATDSRRLVTNP